MSAEVTAPAVADDRGTRARAALRDPGFWAEWTVLPALVLLIVVFGVASGTFLTGDNIEGILASAAVLVVLATGQTYAVATAGIDLSMGSVLTLSGVVLGQLFDRGSPIGVCIAGALLTGLAAGLISGIIIAKARITDFIVTLGMLSVASGVALVLSKSEPVEVLNKLLLNLSTDQLGPFRWTFVVAIAVALVAHLVLFRTRFGTHVLAVGGNPEGSRALGVRVDRIKIAAYGISGLCAGIAAVLLVARVGSAQPAAATTQLLNAVAAVVLGGVSLFGGRATIAGPVAGALLLTALVNGLTLLNVSEAYQPIAVGSVVVGSALLLRFQR